MSNESKDWFAEYRDAKPDEAKPSSGKKGTPKKAAKQSKHFNAGSYDESLQFVEEMMKQHEVAEHSRKERDGATIIELVTCIGDAGHAAGKAHIQVAQNGDVSAGCQHESCKWGFRDLHKHYTGEFPDPPISVTDSDFYQFSEFGITRKKETKDGPVYVPLSNFVSKITEEQLHDDGETRVLIFQVETTCLGQEMPTVNVPASEFASLRFVAEHFGNRAQVFPSMGTRDYLRHAIQVYSGLEVPRRHIFTHTGLTEIDGRLTYLSSTGALDAPTVSVELDATEQPNLSRYKLPMESTPEEVNAGIRASLDFLDVAERSVSIPLWVASYGAAIISEIDDHFASLFLLGPTGCRKTTLGTLALNHHGNFTDENLFSFGATSNFLERAAFTLKDAPMLVDDFYPSTNKRDQDKMVSVFEHLTRNAGNRSGRGRMNADLSLRRTFYPRGMVWFTGEDLIAASSAIARLTLVPVEPDSVDLERLTDLQRRWHLLPHALCDFLRWWRDNRSRAQAIFADKTLETSLHARFKHSLHGRFPRQLALWEHMTTALCYWLIDRNELTEVEAKELHEQAVDVFAQNAFRLQERLASSTPSQRFVEIIQSLQHSGKLWMKDWNVQAPAEEPRPSDEFLGWKRDDYIFAQGETVWHLIQAYCRNESAVFPVGKKTLWEHLTRDGVLELHGSKISESLKVPAEGNKNIRLLKFRADKLLESV